jgi:hypothetical protein
MMNGQSRNGGGGCQANDSEIEMGKQIATISSQQAEWIRENGLTPTTLAPGTNASSDHFPQGKKAVDYILRITAGREVFEFPLEAQNKRPSYE